MFTYALCQTISFRNISNKSSGGLFYADLFTWPLFVPQIKPGDITKEFQLKTIQLHVTFQGL